MRIRPIVILTSASLILSFLLIHQIGLQNFWGLFSIPTMEPFFADLRSITHSGLSINQGLDPLYSNPGDPWGRAMNYPRVWQILPGVGVAPSYTGLIGCVIIASYLAGLIMVFWKSNYALCLAALAYILSPASLLGIERGNVDLLIFFLTSASILLLNRAYVVSLFLVILAFILKLFPIFSLIIFVKRNPRELITIIALVLIFIVFYTFYYFDDLVQIRAGTPISMNLSYGTNVAWMALTTFNAKIGSALGILSKTIVVIWLGFLFYFLFMRKESTNVIQSAELETDRHSDFFKAGAAIYCCTFLLGNNWDYRLIFLILTIPQLHHWSTLKGFKRQAIAEFTLVMILVAMWYLPLSNILKTTIAYGDYVAYLVDQSCKWLTFLSLSFLLVLNLKQDLKKYYN